MHASRLGKSKESHSPHAAIVQGDPIPEWWVSGKHFIFSEGSIFSQDEACVMRRRDGTSVFARVIRSQSNGRYDVHVDDSGFSDHGERRGCEPSSLGKITGEALQEVMYARSEEDRREVQECERMIEEAEGRRQEAEQEVLQLLLQIAAVRKQMEQRGMEFSHRMSGTSHEHATHNSTRNAPHEDSKSTTPAWAAPKVLRGGGVGGGRWAPEGKVDGTGNSTGTSVGRGEAVYPQNSPGVAMGGAAAEISIDVVLLDSLLFCRDAGLDGDDLVNVALQQLSLSDEQHEEARKRLSILAQQITK